MRAVYEEVKTPFKYGVILRPAGKCSIARPSSATASGGTWSTSNWKTTQSATRRNWPPVPTCSTGPRSARSCRAVPPGPGIAARRPAVRWPTRPGAAAVASRNTMDATGSPTWAVPCRVTRRRRWPSAWRQPKIRLPPQPGSGFPPRCSRRPIPTPGPSNAIRSSRATSSTIPTARSMALRHVLQRPRSG